MTLRNYQQKAVEAILESWKTHQTCVVVLPTGCGKTVVFAEVIRRRLAAWTDPGGKTAGRAMVLAHREELVRQAQDKIAARKLATENARRFIVAKAKYSAVSVDPFDLFELAPDPGRVTSPNVGRRLTQRQLEVIWNNFKIPSASLTPTQGRLLLDEVFRRQRAGLATCRQANFLRRKGYPVPMTWDEARVTIDRIINGRVDYGR